MTKGKRLAKARPKHTRNPPKARAVCCGNESEQRTQGQVERKNESSDVIDTQYVPRR